MISTSSVVIAAWRVRLYSMVSRLIMSPALRVALSIAVMRETCSDAAFSSIARNSWIATLRGRGLGQRERDDLLLGRILDEGRLELGVIKPGDVELAFLVTPDQIDGDF